MTISSYMNIFFEYANVDVVVNMKVIHLFYDIIICDETLNMYINLNSMYFKTKFSNL